jgi:hypothetical protein
MSRPLLTPLFQTTRRAATQALLCAAAVLAPWATAAAATTPAAAFVADDDDDDDDYELPADSGTTAAAARPASSANTAASAASPNTAASAATPAPSASSASPATRGTLQFFGENDLCWSDRYYTSGLKIAYTTPEVFTGDLPLFIKDVIAFSPLAENTHLAPAAYRLHVALTHEFYTPKAEHDVNPPPGDHPYAGLFYGTFGVSSETSSRLDALELGVGVIGPAARARQGQNAWHRVIGVGLANGWHDQLRDEPILQLSWTRAGRYEWARSETFGIEWIPRFHVEVGTVRDYAAFGSQWRLGWNLPRDFGIAGIRASNAFTRPDANLKNVLPTSWKPDSAWFYVDAQVEGWIWNSPLDGNAWHDSASVRRLPFVGEFAFGIATQWGGVRMSIAEVLRTKEFRGQYREVSAYTTVSLSLTF